MSSRRLGLVLIVLGVVGLTLTSVGWSGGPMGSGGMMGSGEMSAMHAWMHGSAEGERAAPAPEPRAGDVRVVARDLSFAPDVVTIPSGRTVNLVLANEGNLPHDVSIPALGFHLPAAPGATASGALSVPEPGSFEFFCSVPGHLEAGMSGTLVVK